MHKQGLATAARAVQKPELQHPGLRTCSQGWVLKAADVLQDYFISNYTANYVEDPGLSSNALWATPIYLPAAELLAGNEDLLMAAYEMNATLVTDINDGMPSVPPKVCP